MGDPMFYKPPRDKHKAEAYQDGWDVCSAGGARHDRPNYQTYEEREAFGKGYDDRVEALSFDALRQKAAKALAERDRQYAQGT